MTAQRARAREAGPRPGVPADPHLAAQLRRMALHLETAAVLDTRALRATDPAQGAVLRRRAEQRRQEAQRIRALLVARGVAVAPRGT